MVDQILCLSIGIFVVSGNAKIGTGRFIIANLVWSIVDHLFSG